jgi:glycosyltransferase involved in cell wall biosynthesis
MGQVLVIFIFNEGCHSAPELYRFAKRRSNLIQLISIIVTGRDDSMHLREVFQSIRKLQLTYEIIYFDLNSKDESIEIAKRYSDRVYTFKNDGYIHHSAGRWSGTIVANFDWVLYLDGNMVLRDEFIAFINSRAFTKSRGLAGFVGNYSQVLVEKSENNLHQIETSYSKLALFEGGLLAKKEKILRAGNWNPSVTSYGEVDLHARILKQGLKVQELHIPMITQRFRRQFEAKRFVEKFFPTDHKFFGFGQLIVSQFTYAAIPHFFLLNPFPYLIVMSLLHVYLYGAQISYIAVGVVYASILFFKGPVFLLIHSLEVLRGALGIFTYQRKRPVYQMLDE